jgi:hypothetical protein
MKNEKDYYQILGVKPNATLAEIRRAYRRLAILNHPDKNSNPQATVRMQEINEAYNTIGDKNKRIKYDFEYSNSTDSVFQKKSSYNKDTTNLQQFSAEDLVPQFNPLPVSIAFLVLSAACFLVTLALTLEPFSIFPTLTFLGLLSALPFHGALTLWKYLKSNENEAKCPRCGNLWAAEKLNEKLIGIFERAKYDQNSRTFAVYNYQKYKTHYKCKYCNNEWLLLKSRKQ